MVQTTMQHGDLLISGLVEYSRRVFPEAKVITWTGEGTREASFADIGDQGAQIANALTKLGVARGDRVATFMWNNTEHQALYAGVPSMGAVLHTLNLRLSPEQAVFIINHADDKVIFVDASVAPMLSQYLTGTPNVKHVVVANGPVESLTAPEGVTVHAYDDLIAGEPTTYDWPKLDETDAAVMCYTSGTTGDPKGVVYSHRSIYLHSLLGTSTSGMGLSNHDTMLAIVPMFHVMSWGLPYAAMMAGATLVMPDRFLQPEPLLAMMAETRPTLAAAVPTIWQGVSALLDAKPQDITHLREVVVGGAAVPPSMITKFDGYGVKIVHAWGMTETSPLGTISRPPAGVEDEDAAFAYRVTQGRFPAPVAARIVGDDGQEQPWDGEARGELEVSGPWITGSYYQPDGNVADPSKFDDGWLRTGDVATITPDGYMTIVDRAKDIIKTGGEWISSVELENVIASNPAVVEATVIGVPDAKWDERPFVLAVVRDEADADVEAHRKFLEDRIPRWQIPERWSFVTEVPKTSVGKFDKKRVRQHYADGDYTVLGEPDA
ncbi:long-chain fatty acid--CoA ligase [Gordonia sp. PS3]|uniref:Long-chain fatty-acid--CoA ligase FadD n=1 Tax=Gordonia sihwensis NBRC 108236 TaxID=1223544 RepID=L7LPL1_9ACTN|nr:MULTISPECIES: long-chain fatty acid--CoA ligase [Gordonia]AUH68299.1 long-chain fatty acid--CoA ligase [Gordonia sp. YC-JH1]WFN91937.1 long-chain fatty acid--CoA ligase [Gordonia sihwensis]GAC62864.1 long-chain fatty-acid--CoA ligase FadD [Gordonia sihwensis NBRC 108236]